MRPFHLGALLAGSLVVLTLSESAGAQAPSPAVLNALELQELIRRAQPGDHARLEVHFAVLAEQYAADARLHSAMAQAFSDRPIRRKAADSAADHCRRLERLNLKSAATLRQLAAHHQRLAAHKASAVPRGATPFEGGAGARLATEQELTALAAKANTPADHRALHEYFLTVAKRYAADGDDHLAAAQAYRSALVTQPARHCDRLAALSRDEAKEATAAAAMHKQLAGLGP